MSDEFNVSALQADVEWLQQQMKDFTARLGEQLERERKRNDIQARRIKALVGVVEKLSHHLIAAQVVSPEGLQAELAELEEASRPVQL
ncbi:MAG TPA: hypothetical protein VE153_21675 [Myxococcus sp.]|nr:hypothetical protein [Myxococcus sp.]